MTDNEKIHTEEIIISRTGYELRCLLAEPGKDFLADNPALLLNFSSSVEQSIDGPEYRVPGHAFIEAGHRVLSFDLPNHGDRINRFGEGIPGMRDAFLAGEDPFALFAEDGAAAIDICLEKGLASAGRIAVCGTSRGGYCALRLAAAEPRIAAAAGLAPVTDWRHLREFDSVKDEAAIAGLALVNWAPSLAGRPVFLAIGNQDRRVSTFACMGLARRLLALEEPNIQIASSVELHILPSEKDHHVKGHRLETEWRMAGGRFLLRSLLG